MKLNKKGYMLIEIILASVIAFGVGYFILQLVINLKNKNDDLLVETLTTTDQTIIMNKLMYYAKKENNDFTCKITTDGKTLYYEDKEGNNNIITILNDYAAFGNEINCDYTDNRLQISIPLDVKQLADRDFDVKFDYNPYSANDPSSSTTSGLYKITTETCKSANPIGGGTWHTIDECIATCNNACRTTDSGSGVILYICDSYCASGQTYSDGSCYYRETSVSYGSECAEKVNFDKCGSHSINEQNIKCYSQ